MTSCIPLVLMVVWCIFFSLGEYFSRVWVDQPGYILPGLVFSCYGVSVAAWLGALLDHGKLAALSTVFSSLAMVSAVLIGVLVFREQLQPRQIAGIVLAVLACLLTY